MHPLFVESTLDSVLIMSVLPLPSSRATYTGTRQGDTYAVAPGMVNHRGTTLFFCTGAFPLNQAPMPTMADHCQGVFKGQSVFFC